MGSPARLKGESMNIAAITGRLTRDPELKSSQNGRTYTNFRVAVPRPGVKDQTDFLDCVAYDKTAEFVTRYFHKGSRIEVNGYLKSNSREKDGVKWNEVAIVVSNVSFGESKKEETGGGSYQQGNYGSYQQPQYAAPPQYTGYQQQPYTPQQGPTSAEPTTYDELDDDSQLPF